MTEKDDRNGQGCFLIALYFTPNHILIIELII